MKKYQGEIQKDNYQNFPYGKHFIILNEKESYSDYYNRGYQVTFIKDSTKEKPIFYLNREVRINLKKFELNSENRRIWRKTQYLDYYTVEEKIFRYDPILLGKPCLKWFAERFPEAPMHISKIKRIFTNGINNLFFIFHDIAKGVNIGYAATLEKEDFIHYSSPFYNPEYYKRNLGMGMMLRAVLWAKKKNKKYIYLGTCNRKNAVYKTQFKGVEWFDGKNWSEDIKDLRRLFK